jgi:glycosyl transferase family 25
VARAQQRSLDPLSSTFDMVRIINLPHRSDRRKGAVATLRNLGAEIDGRTIAFHDATRPDSAGGFPTIGTRGCFLSHLGALQAAKRAGATSLLILEDDVAISRKEMTRLPGTLAALAREPWDVFYGGSPATETASPLSAVAPDEELLLAHFIAFSKRAIDALVPYLEAILTREPGSPEGGPMHVDGAYSWFRAARPDMRAFAATPHIAHQQSSRTDIHALGASDTTTVLQPFLQVARTIKNAIRNRN